jgi:hypothetical protein
LYLPPKLVCIHQNFLQRVYTNLNSSFLDPSFLEWRHGCKTCIVYTGLKIGKCCLAIGHQLPLETKFGLLWTAANCFVCQGRKILYIFKSFTYVPS